MARPSALLKVLALAAGAGLAEAAAPDSLSAAPAACAALQPDRRGALGEEIGLVRAADVPAELVRDAIALWQGCSGYESGFPAFRDGPGGTRTLRVRYELASDNPRCGGFRGTEIVVYAWAMENGRRRPCGPPAVNLAHELGHALGLADAPAACGDRIMAPVDPARPGARAVRADECRIAEAHWLTAVERAELRGAAAVNVARVARAALREWRPGAAAAPTPARTRW
jgi:hypothetical protein